MEVERVISDKYFIEPNDLYLHGTDSYAENLKTCPLTSELRRVQSTTHSAQNTIFDLFVNNENQFVSTSMEAVIPMNFIINVDPSQGIGTDANGTTNKPTRENFVATAFNNFAELILAKNGLNQAIETVELTVGNAPISNSRYNVVTNIVSDYYSAASVDEYFQASQPDRFPKFEMYDHTAGTPILLYDDLGNVSSTAGANDNEQNIFKPKYDKRYSTRTPVMELKDAKFFNYGTANAPDWKYTQFHVRVLFFVRPALSLCTLPNAPSSLSGVKNLKLSITYDSARLPGLVFNQKKVNGSFRYTNISVDQSLQANDKAFLYTQIYTPPSFMMADMKDKLGKLKPYKLQYPRITPYFAGNPIQASPGRAESNTFMLSSMSLPAIPKAIYIALVRTKNGQIVNLTNTTNTFGLINSLQINIDSSTTNFPDLMSVKHLARSNGYDKLDDQGMILSGFAVKVDLTKDLNIPGDVLVGQSTSANLSISGTFTNPCLHTGMEDATFKDEFQPWVLIVDDSDFIFDGTNFSTSTGVGITQQMLNTNHFKETVWANQAKPPKVLGGGIFSNAWKSIKQKVPELARYAWDHREQIMDMAQKAAETVSKTRGKGTTATLGAGFHSNISGAGHVGTTIFKGQQGFK